MKKIIALDVGSSNIKACVFDANDKLNLLYNKTVKVGLYSPKIGYAEHDANEMWNILSSAIKDIFSDGAIKKEDIALVSICSQAQCVVLVDKDGNALTPVFNSQDARAVDTFKKYYSSGLTFADLNLRKLLICLFDSGFLPGSAKDPVFKFKWAEDNMKEAYAKSYKWLDIKDFLIMKLTGEFVTTTDNAHAYTIYKSNKNNKTWAKKACGCFKVDMNKLPKVVDCKEVVGTINEKVSKETGLAVGTPVIGGLIDSSAVQYGSGAAEVGETMIYWGTSGWIGAVTDKFTINVVTKCGSLIASEKNRFHYYEVLDSAGASYAWIKEHIVSDDGLLGTVDTLLDGVYNNMNEVLKDIPTGSDGLMFAPWITGVRAPMEASDIGGMFINIKRNMGKKHFIKAVAEGICYHYRLLMESNKKNVKYPKVVRFVGGGAKSVQIAQILADITGCTVEVPYNPQNAGVYGAAILALYALGENNRSLVDVAHLQKAEKVFTPIEKNSKIYDKYYSIYKKIYRKNHKILSNLTKIRESVGE